MPASTCPTDTRACDCCGDTVPREQIAVVIAYGIETGACCACRGVEPDDELTEAEITAAARICPVFKTLTGAR